MKHGAESIAVDGNLPRRSFFKEHFMDFAMLVYQTVYIGVVCENLEDIQGNTWGNARSPHRVAMSSRSVAFWASVKRHAFCVQRQRTSNSESSHGNHHIIFQQTVPLCHVFFVVCINPLVHHLKQRPQKTCWRLASWSDPFFLQKLENTCKQFRQTLDQELQC